MNTKESNKKVIENKMFSIKEVANKLQLSEVYVRRMILKGKLQTTKVALNQNQFKHMIQESEVNRWRASVKASGKARSDGRNKWILYSNENEFKQLQQLLEQNELKLEVRRANKVKTIS